MTKRGRHRAPPRSVACLGRIWHWLNEEVGELDVVALLMLYGLVWTLYGAFQSIG